MGVLQNNVFCFSFDISILWGTGIIWNPPTPTNWLHTLALFFFLIFCNLTLHINYCTWLKLIATISGTRTNSLLLKSSNCTVGLYVLDFFSPDLPLTSSDRLPIFTVRRSINVYEMIDDLGWDSRRRLLWITFEGACRFREQKNIQWWLGVCNVHKVIWEERVYRVLRVECWEQNWFTPFMHPQWAVSVVCRKHTWEGIGKNSRANHLSCFESAAQYLEVLSSTGCPIWKANEIFLNSVILLFFSSLLRGQQECWWERK